MNLLQTPLINLSKKIRDLVVLWTIGLKTQKFSINRWLFKAVGPYKNVVFINSPTASTVQYSPNCDTNSLKFEYSMGTLKFAGKMEPPVEIHGHDFQKKIHLR